MESLDENYIFYRTGAFVSVLVLYVYVCVIFKLFICLVTHNNGGES